MSATLEPEIMASCSSPSAKRRKYSVADSYNHHDIVIGNCV
jgi:hypothetical protein